MTGGKLFFPAGKSGNQNQAGMAMPLFSFKKFSVDDLIDLIVTLTVCFGIFVTLMVINLMIFLNPDAASQLIGTVSPQKGVGVGALLFSSYLILRLVYRRRKKNAK